MINEILITILIIWAGIALLLYRLDRKLSRIEEEMDEL